SVEVPATLDEAAERAAPALEVPVEREVAAERGPGGEREARPSRGRIWLSFGEADGADEAKVRELVAGLVPGAELLAVELRRSHSFLEVRPEAIDAVVDGLNGKLAGDKPLTAEKARRRRR
ncbi:MAG TPA: hypothetical protein VFP50_06240, partial [Anaeromyxobacteraceae bacterium]|nr:hypothetical protein [Anaeromyxobacteraceae bacterium]